MFVRSASGGYAMRPKAIGGKDLGGEGSSICTESFSYVLKKVITKCLDLS